MVIESVGPQIHREQPVRPTLDQPEIVEALKHGNIYEILKAPGVNRNDIEEYLSGQWRLFQNRIVQNYEVYKGPALVPPPEINDMPVHSREMHFSGEERRFFQQDMEVLREHYKAEVLPGPKPKVRYRATESGAAEDVISIGQKALDEHNEFMSELAVKMIDNQMMQELQSKSAELNREVSRIISLVQQGVVDPEYVLIAAAKSNMLQNGTLFTWKGKRVAHLNDQMNKVADELLAKDVNDIGFLKDQQKAAAQTRSGQQQMQLEMMDLQKFAQNVATTLEWVSNAIRMFQQMRQTPTQAIAARR